MSDAIIKPNASLLSRTFGDIIFSQVVFFLPVLVSDDEEDDDDEEEDDDDDVLDREKGKKRAILDDDDVEELKGNDVKKVKTDVKDGTDEG